MVLSSDNVPFCIALGLDLTENEDFDFNKTSNWLNELTNINVDYIVSHISIKDQKLRRNFCQKIPKQKIDLENFQENEPILINDFQMKFHMWKNKFISKIHEEDLKKISENFDLITQDLNYANYINSKSSILEIDLEKIFENFNFQENENVKENELLSYEFYLVKLIKQFFSENVGRHLSISLNFTKNNFFFYTKLQNLVKNVDNFEVLLKIDNELPDEVRKY